MAHTPGEWKVTTWASHNEIHVSSDERSEILTFIASCGNLNSDTLPHNPNALANAHLISASPDMYEALKGILQVAQPYSDRVFEKKYHGLFIVYGNRLDTALEAISKADGND